MTCMQRLLCLTTLLLSFHQCASLSGTGRYRGGLQEMSDKFEAAVLTSSSAPTYAPSSTPTYAPSSTPTSPTNQVTPSVAPTSTANNASKVPTVAPSSADSKTPTAAPTATHTNEKETTAPTTAPVPAVTTAPTAAPVTPPAPAPHKFSVWRFIEKTIALFIMLVLALLGFGAIMNNRYRIYFFLRGVWYTILGLDCTHRILRKLGLRSYQPVDGGLNTVIFENEMDEGLLMRETDT